MVCRKNSEYRTAARHRDGGARLGRPRPAHRAARGPPSPLRGRDKLGNYIRDSLRGARLRGRWRDRLAFTVRYSFLSGIFVLVSLGGIQAGATKNLPPRMIIGISGGASMSVGSAVIVASDTRAGGMSPFRKISTNGLTVRGRAPSNPRGSYTNVPKLWTSAARRYIPTLIPAEKNAFWKSEAYHHVSASVSYPIFTCSNWPASPWMKSHCAWLSSLGRNWFSSSALARSAFAARSIASASFAFERLRNSVWIRESILPDTTSPTMPMAIQASVIADPHRQRLESYGGWTAAIITSTATAATTNPANIHSQNSNDDDAPSNSSLLAFIVPFGRRHDEKSFRGFWVGLLVSLLMFGTLFAVSFALK